MWRVQSEHTVYNQSAVAHYDFNTHPCCKKLGENKFTKASEQTLDWQQQKLTLYANILILFKDSAYTNINIIVQPEDLTKSLPNLQWTLK